MKITLSGLFLRELAKKCKPGDIAVIEIKETDCIGFQRDDSKAFRIV